jgi:hypothetical protein
MRARYPPQAVSSFLGGMMSDFNGEEFGARGYAVSTVGFALEAVQQEQRYVREQDAGDSASALP